jgi:HAD superfamily hydrolase (TIGR01549 family)
MIRAIVFDVDGVLLESSEVKTKAFATLFSIYPEHLDAILQLHINNGVMSRFEKFRIIYRDILKKPLPEKEFDSLCRRFKELVFNGVLSCKMVKGSREFMENHYSKYLLFVITATPHEEIVEVLRRRNLLGYFKFVYGAPTSKKEALKKILEEFSLSSAEAVYIGDSLNDYNASKALGVRFIGRLHRENQNTLDFLESKDTIGDLTELALKVKGYINDQNNCCPAF